MRRPRRGAARARAGAAVVAVAAALTGCGSGPTGTLGTPSAHPATTVTAPTTVSAPTAAFPPSTPTAASVPVPHVMVVVMENRDYSSVIGDSSAPRTNDLANRFALATRAYGASHPSLPNYLDLVAGSTFQITDDCTSCSVDGTTLVDQLKSRGIDWRAYMEGAPDPCYLGASSSSGYAKKHDPFVYFAHIRSEPSLCNRVVAGSQLQADMTAGRLPPFVWVTPDLCNDGHDCSTAHADTYLGNLMNSILASSWYTAGAVVIVTWDEGGDSSGCCSGAHGGHIATVVVSGAVRPGARLDTPVDHAGTLRTIETLYRLPLLGDAACPCSGSLLPLLGR